MKDLERLRVSGSDEDQALLREADGEEVPGELRSRVRQAVEERVSPRGRRRAGWRLLLASAVTLAGGTALAYGVVQVRARLAAPTAAPSSTPPGSAISARPAPPAPTTTEAPPAPRPAVATVATSRRAAAAAERARPLPSLGGPGLAAPPTGEDPPAPVAPPAMPSGRLLIQHQGRRPVTILLHGPRISGDVRGLPVDLELRGQRILGKAADQPFALLLQGSEASGNIAGQDVAFELAPTRGGAVVRGGLPGHSARIEIDGDKLSWFPGCDEELTETTPGSGVYRGRCEGAPAQVVIPPAWQRLPRLPRFILLALFLTEREPGLPDHPPALFGPPDWPHPR
jgi:hypothetical protein